MGDVEAKGATGSIDMQDLSGLRTRPHPVEVGIFRGLVFGLALALDAALLLFLLLLFAGAFSDSFFQAGS
jgi:hypothetical protein